MKNQVEFDKIGVGCGIEIPNHRFGNRTDYYVVINISDDDIYETVSVWPIDDTSELYMNSNNPRNKDNVPLWSCPPPFTSLDSDAYAAAHVNRPVRFSKSDFETLGIEISDNYAKVSNHDMKLIFDHDLEQIQEELIFKEQNTYTRELPFVDSSNDRQSSFDFDKL